MEYKRVYIMSELSLSIESKQIAYGIGRQIVITNAVVILVSLLSLHIFFCSDWRFFE